MKNFGMNLYYRGQKVFKYLFSKNEDDIQTFLEGYDHLQGEWKSIDSEIKYKKDCEKCPHFKTCEEW